MIRIVWMLLIVPMVGCHGLEATDRELAVIWNCHERATNASRFRDSDVEVVYSDGCRHRCRRCVCAAGSGCEQSTAVFVQGCSASESEAAPPKCSPGWCASSAAITR